MTSSVRKKVPQKYALFMHNKCPYRISSFYERRTDTAEHRIDTKQLKQNIFKGTLMEL